MSMKHMAPSPLDTGDLNERLHQKRLALIKRISDQLHRSDDSALLSLASQIAEVDDWEVAELLCDTESTMLGDDLAELRDIDLALQRVANGTYGACVDCGRAIDPVRLDARPAARECIICKTAFEKRRGIVRKPIV